MICAHMAQYIPFFFAYEKKIAQKHAVLQQDLKFQKMRGNERGGHDLKIMAPLRF